jgi:membrane protein YqaA with SNARE-associated domain
VNLEQLGQLGVFIAGAIPWFEAIAVVPAGILFGLDPLWVVLAAIAGNALTIFVFAYFGASIRGWVSRRRLAKGKPPELKRFEKAQQAFDRYGIYGLAALGPILVGTQFAAAIAVAVGVKPLKTALLITAGMVLWAVLVAIPFTLLGPLDFQASVRFVTNFDLLL